jgi:tetratricopeptide (TPR) repeat protein
VEALLRRAIEEVPDQLGPRDRLATRLEAAGRPDEARATLEEAAELFDTPQAWQRLARLDTEQQDYERAHEALDRAMEGSEEPPEPMRFAQAELLAALGEHERALEIVAEFEERSYRDLVRGRIALAEGRNQEALDALEAALLRWPDNVRGRMMAGQAAERLGRPSEAIDHYVNATRGDPAATDAALAAARLLYATGEFRKAVELARKHVKKRDAGSVDALRIAVRSATALGEFDDARESAANMAKLPDGRVPALVEQAGVERRARGRAAALALIDQSDLDLTEPAHAEALRSAVDDLVALGRPEEATMRLDRALAAHPDQAEWHELRAVVLIVLGRSAEARASAERALELEPGRGPALGVLGRVAQSEARTDEALELFDRAAAADNPDPAADLLAAQLLIEQGRDEEGEQRLRDVVGRQPQNAYAANELAWRLAQRGDELAYALELAERAAGLDPRAEILDTLGWAQLQSGDAASAVATFERVLAQQPGSASVRYRYAMALEAQGRKDEARAALETVLAGGPFPEVEAARAQLATLEAERGARP